jgi:polycystin 2
MWATRQTEQENLGNRDVYIKTTLRELIIYIFFLVVLSISKYDTWRERSLESRANWLYLFVVAFGMVNINMFYLTDSMTNLYVRRFMPDGFTNYEKLVTVSDYWMVSSPLCRHVAISACS